MDDLANNIASAYQAGDYGTVNDLIAQNQLTQSDIGNMFPGFDASAVNPVVSYFNPSDNAAPATNNFAQPDYSQASNLVQTATPQPQTAMPQSYVEPYVQQPIEPPPTGIATLGATPLAITPPAPQALPADQTAAVGLNTQPAVSAQPAVTNDQITSYLNNTLNDTSLDTFGKISNIYQAADANKVTAQQIADATGKDVKSVQALLDSYGTGVAALAKNITSGNQTPTQIIQNSLAAEQKYGISDADFAKSLGLKQSDVSAYLQPARDTLTQLKDISSDPSVTSTQVQDLISKIGSDPTLTNMYGSQAKTLQNALPTLQFKDAYTAANSGEGTAADILGNYKQMVDIANNNPALSKQFGPQIQAVQQALQMSGNGQHLSTFETFTGLDKGITSQATNLPTKTVTQKFDDGTGTAVPVTSQVIDTSKLPKGVMAVSDDNGNTTYEQQIKTPPGWDPGTKVFARYDENGQLTGYYSPNPVFPTDANGNMDGKRKYDAVWNADGSAKPQVDTSHGGVFSSLAESLAPGAGIIAMGLSGGLAGPLTEAITGALTGAGMTTGANILGGALSQGIIRGGAAALGGGNFAKGFDTGVLGGGITAGLNNLLPSGVGQYVSSPVANAIASSAVNGTNLGQGLTNAIQSGGLNYGLNSLLPSVLPDNITPNKTMTGIASTLLPKLINNQSITQNDLFNILPKLAQGAKT